MQNVAENIPYTEHGPPLYTTRVVTMLFIVGDDASSFDGV